MARASTRRSMSRPLRERSSGVSRWLMRSTSWSMIGPSSRSRGDVMRGGADQLDAALMRLVIGTRALEARQERVMDVDAAPRQSCRHLVRQDLHVTRQHHEIGLCVLHQFPDRIFLLAPGLLRHRQIVKRNLAEIEIAVGLARMVGDDSGRDHLEFAGAPAIEDIDEAMIGFRDQQHHPAAAGAVAHLPVHAEAVGDRGKAGLQRRQIDREIGGGEHHPHEEFTGLDVVELLGVENVLPVMGKKGRHRRNDAGAIRTGQGQDELMIGHGADAGYNSGRRVKTSICALLYHRAYACANPETGVMMNKAQSKGAGARSWQTD